jgi:hypothetical protein
VKKEILNSYEFPGIDLSMASEVDQINELLIAAKAHGIEWDVVNVAKAIQLKTNCTDLSAFLWAYKLYAPNNA